MLPRKHRFSPRKEAPDFFKTAVSVGSSGLVLFANRYKTSGQACLKATVIVPKKVARDATDRNKLKRLLRQALIRLVTERSELPLCLAVVAKPAILKADSTQVYQSLMSLVDRVGKQLN